MSNSMFGSTCTVGQQIAH